MISIIHYSSGNLLYQIVVFLTISWKRRDFIMTLQIVHSSINNKNPRRTQTVCRRTDNSWRVYAIFASENFHIPKNNTRYVFGWNREYPTFPKIVRKKLKKLRSHSDVAGNISPILCVLSIHTSCCLGLAMSMGDGWRWSIGKNDVNKLCLVLLVLYSKAN